MNRRRVRIAASPKVLPCTARRLARILRDGGYSYLRQSAHFCKFVRQLVGLASLK